MEYKDYYQILGVGKQASTNEIKAAYRKLARKYHPDVNPGDKSSETKFKEINEAYEVLKDPEKRQKYEQFGAYWEKAGSGFPGGGTGGFPGGLDFSNLNFGGARGRGGSGGGQVFSGFSDFFDLLFGGQSPQAGGWQNFDPGGGRGGGGGSAKTAYDIPGWEYPSHNVPQKGEDLEYQLGITLEEAIRGNQTMLSLEKPELCPKCGGKGREGRAVCPVCRGSSQVGKSKKIRVNIPAGVREGSKIRLKGEGSPAPRGIPAGDLFLLIKLLPHPLYELKGADLYADLPLTIPEAVLGGEIEVPTLRGKVKMKIPPRTQSGKTFRLGGQGLPAFGDKTPGDLYLKTQIMLPETINPEQEKFFKTLQNQPQENPRQKLLRGGGGGG